MKKKRLPDNLRKSEGILIRLSPEELQILTEAARLHKLKTSTYTRSVALGAAETSLHRLKAAY